MTTSYRRKRSVRDWVVDSLAFVFGVVGGLLLHSAGEDDGSSQALLAVDLFSGMALCVLLWFRRRWPIQLFILAAIVGTYSEASAMAGLLITITVAIYCPLRVTLGLMVFNLLSLWIYTEIRPNNDPVIVTYITVVTLYVAVVGWGLYIRSRRTLLQALRDRADRAETVAQLQAQQAQMRAREEIAREMHDVLGHRLSLLSVHAGALAYRPDATTDEVAGAAEIIRASAHQALQDLREVIGVLRAPVGELPQPTFADLPALVEDSRRAGMPVDLDFDAHGTLPDHVGRTAYRIVQEGLTNALKHAPGAPVNIRVTGAPGNGLEVEVRNPAPRRRSGQGQGLIGLSERAALVDGRLEHGRTAEGDFRISAWLPWPS
ncbi:MAG TPA: histidine kinase [Kribbella sp.]|uniref:sensor histidine kinase n=1 Tax=Kribbella sp. TaxID=1871183 RepID=UPI002D7A341F|nr:histidine kinase [Kribbella sp.]HET6297642.1 histidine kinase [Kribbella sp.]